MKHFCKLFTAFCLFSSLAHSASVRSASQITQLNFGSIGPGTSVGSIGKLTGSGICSTNTGGVVSFGGCTDGSFTLSTRNGGGGVSVANGKKKFRVHIPASVTTISSGDTVLAFGSVSGCSAATSPSPPAGYIAIDCENTSSSNNANQDWTIPVIGKISNISITQSSATYTPSYQFIACRCNNGCPNSITHNKCTRNNAGVILNQTLSANIYKSLEIVEDAQLKFGTIIPSGSISTVNQAGTVLSGGATQISSLLQFSGNSPSAGQFTVSGEASFGTPYSFSLPTNTSLSCNSTGCTGAPAMNVNLSFSAGNSSRTLDASGNDVVIINGVLTVGANQLAGSYVGTYNITLNY